MKLHNIRLGFACNSSSTHSIVFLDGPASDDVSGQEFGWDYWTASTPESKLKYLGQTLKHELSRHMPTDAAAVVAKDWLGIEVEEEGYVDHQSVIHLPMNWDGNSVNKQFVKDFAAFLCRDDVAILGGNDNDDVSHPLSGNTANLPLEDESSSPQVARKDSRGYWTIFNRSTGTKVRFSFESLKERTIHPEKSDTPELVDIKITDKCPYGCTYCYQGSVPSGEHADKSYLDSLVYTLKSMNVFEVAIGGGEPTLSPHFTAFMSQCKYNGIVPNFTTRNIHWFRDPANLKLFKEACGAVAYSVDTADQIKAAASLGLGRPDWSDPTSGGRMTIQYVVGAGQEHELRSILHAAKEANLPITLLGYKTTGRGGNLKPRQIELIKLLADMNKAHELPYRLGIDTTLAEMWGEQLKAAGVSERTFTTKEGQFSCYIDAVAKKIGPSSYDPKNMVDLAYPSTEAITKAFATF